MQIHLIWAQEKDGGIGIKGKLPWSIPQDLQNFKNITLNSTILMGRKTWESLPFKPLPKRRNIVLSRKKYINSECYKSAKECIDNLKEEKIEKLFVIGGSNLYKRFITIADELHITHVDENTENIDTYFPQTIEEIEQNFKKVNQYQLSKNAIYSNWNRIK